MKARVFIGSAQESLKIAYEIQAILSHDKVADVTVWPQDVYGLSKGTLDDLLAALRKYDFGVFVLSGEDITVLRDRVMASTRDNVVFELGLFMGHLGKDRTAFVTPEAGSDHLRIPTDLLGITYATFDADREDGNLRASLQPACLKIHKWIREATERPRSVETQLYTLIGLFNEPPVEIENPYFQTFHYHKDHNVNPIANLWADPLPGNFVHATLCQGAQPEYFARIAFESAVDCFPPAVGIHPEGLRARKVTKNYDHLTFKARLVPSRKGRNACATAIAIRLVDGYVQHWEYKTRTGEQIMFPLSPEWQPFSVNLREEACWRPFYGAGNHAFGPQKKNFEILASVIFEFGCKRSARSLGHGKGIVELFDLQFGSAQ